MIVRVWREGTTVVRKLGDHRWVAATEYGTAGGMGRSGVWVPQRSGGWWTHPWSIDHAIDSCPDPVTYRTKREALDN